MNETEEGRRGQPGGSPSGAQAGLTDEVVQALVAAAAAVRQHAYVAYSQFPVGAALWAADGTIYTGCNVENASYGLTTCAERNAVAHGVAHGARRFEAVAIVTANGVLPCGACRQVLAEFNPEMTVIIADTEGNQRWYRLSELLPHSFRPEHLRRSARPSEPARP